MKIISHRGAAGLALENTAESIKAALKLPVFAIELDVRRSADGQLVLSHDKHTGHISGKTLLVQNSTLEELRAVTLHNDEKIPTLEEAFKLIGAKKPIMLDIKSNGVADQLFNLLARYPQVKVFLSGRPYDELARIHKANPRLPFLIQHHYDPMEVVHRAKRMGAFGICLNLWLMNPLTYRLARQEGLEVYVYTLNRRWLLKFFQILYPEAVIITNHPEKML